MCEKMNTQYQLNNKNGEKIMKKSMLSISSLAFLSLCSTNFLMAAEFPEPGTGSKRISGITNTILTCPWGRFENWGTAASPHGIHIKNTPGSLFDPLTHAFQDLENYIQTLRNDRDSLRNDCDSLTRQLNNLEQRSEAGALATQQFHGALSMNKFADAHRKLTELFGMGASQDYQQALQDQFIGNVQKRAEKMVIEEFLGAQDMMPERQAHTEAFLQQLPPAYVANITDFSNQERLRIRDLLNVTNPDLRNALLLGLLANV